MAVYRVEDRYMVRRVTEYGVDNGNYEIVDKRTNRRPWIGDVYATKEVAARLCSAMNKENDNGTR